MCHELKINEVMRGLEEAGYVVEKSTVTKANDIVKQGFLVKKDAVVAPFIYFEDLIEDFENGASVGDVLSHVISCVERPDIKIGNFMDFEEIKDKIIYRIVSSDNNQEYLKDKPCLKFDGFTLIFAILVDTMKESIATSVVTNELKRIWKVNLCDLTSHAFKNTPKYFPAKLCDMESVLVRLFMDDDDKESDNLLNSDGVLHSDGMYVLTNEIGINGASVIMYENLLHDIAERMGTDRLILLPSSVHEVILIKAGDDLSSDSLTEMINDVNMSEVPEGDVLAGRPFLYEKDGDRITVM